MRLRSRMKRDTFATLLNQHPLESTIQPMNECPFGLVGREMALRLDVCVSVACLPSRVCIHCLLRHVGLRQNSHGKDHHARGRTD